MKHNQIIIRGARQHNLKNVNLKIPRNKLIVITGLSGSGKSSLAFDTLYAEGQRRYVESLSAYARQFLDRMQKPELDHIEGLSPSIAIEQRSSGSNPRSTVATTTEIYDYLRLLYAHAGTPHCPECGIKLQAQSAESIVTHLSKIPPGRKMMILAPFVQGRKGEHKDIIETIQREGFVRARIDGEICQLENFSLNLEKNKKHNIEAVVDRLISGKTERSRLTDTVETALKCSGGTIIVLSENPEKESAEKWNEERISEDLACDRCGLSFSRPEPRNFSFNSPYGACSKCNGLGSLYVMDPELTVEHPEKSIKKGAIPNWRKGPRRIIMYYNHLIRSLAKHYEEDKLLTTPFNKLSEKMKNILLYGSGEEVINFDFWRRGKVHKMRRPFEGILPNLERRYVQTETESVRKRLKKCMERKICPACRAARLKPENLAVTVNDLPIHEFNALSISRALDFIKKIKLSREKEIIAEEIIRELKQRISFLADVGLNYLTLNRESGTLSGGEAQRIRLASQLGCGLVGVVYVLDEPSIGLHQKDNHKLLKTLKKLRDIGNTVIVVEHDHDTINSADHIIDLGPGAGRLGGKIIAQGTAEQITSNKNSITGQYISGKSSISIPETRNKGNSKKLKIIGAEHNNLKNIDAEIPLGTFTCITGVSGSGKSSLIDETLKRAVFKNFNIKTENPGKFKEVRGLENIQKMIVIDQSPIGRTPRSNPATYTDTFGKIRKLFSELKESKMRGYKPGRFSFNVKGGRCEECKGDGIKKIEMLFLPDVYVTCSRCNGKRFNSETLNVRLRGKNIAEILEMTVDEAVEHFDGFNSINRKLRTLSEVGLGYIHLGQPATTLSGGEAQRVKLASELSRIPKGHTLYILDEPTTGLHSADIKKLLEVLLKLRDKGNTVLIIEHNLEVIKVADHIIDLGPEGGDSGGEILASGTPETVIKNKKSYTGKYLKKVISEKGFNIVI